MKRILKKIVVFILTVEARLVLLKYNPRVIAVTGTVGKTATKDAIAAVLGESAFVRASSKSFNSEIGVPLTILGCDNAWGSVLKWLGIFTEGLALIVLKNHYPNALVLEVGTDRPGDIGRIASWLYPHVVVVTAFAEVPVHVEFFGSREELLREKASLVDALRSGGTLVINGDDPDVAALRAGGGRSTVIFGTNEDAHVRASDAEVFYGVGGIPEGISARVHYKGNLFPLNIRGTIGTHYIYAALAALSVGITEGRNMVSLLEALGGFAVPPGRLKLLDGVNGTIIADDSYNASPKAAAAALDALDSVRVSGRKIAVLGDMLELGKYTADEHRKLGARAAEVCDIVATVGARAELIGEEARKAGMSADNTPHFQDSRTAGTFLRGIVDSGDIVLVKGSQGIRMERTVGELILDPKDAGRLLVRQEREWQGK